MRISDWSSDVCSSDLDRVTRVIGERARDREYPDGGDLEDRKLHREHAARARFGFGRGAVMIVAPFGDRGQAKRLGPVAQQPPATRRGHDPDHARSPETEDRKSTRLNSSH